MRFIYISFIILYLSLLSCHKQATVNPSSDQFVETIPPILQPNHVAINDAIAGFYSALPAKYSESSKKYPLLIFIHGSGQFGNGDTELHEVLTDGVPELLNHRLFPPNFKVNGSNYSFIILAPQLKIY